MLSATCPGCAETLELPEGVAGCPIRCPLCRHEFAAPDLPAASAGLERSPADLADAPAPRPPRRPKMSAVARNRRPRRKRQTRTALLIVGLITAGVVLVCGGGGVGMYFLFVHEIEVPVVAADRSLIVTAERLRDFQPSLDVDPARETYHKVRLLDGSREVTYTYEYTHDDESVLYVSHQVNVETTRDGAEGGYAGLRIGMNYFGFKKIQQVVRNDLWKWGDKSTCAILTYDSKKVGNLFMARKGRRYFFLLIVGVYFEDSGPIHELLDPVLQRLDAYEG